jgi:hypothetical protein
MRFLNKVIFINSATIRYAEVMLNGNVHLIGTQGVGKSTLLRAVLFFYNADTLKLGISKEKKSFSEYYFPYQNSYLVYEVIRENGPYCIIAFKSQGKVCFRFIDTGFDRKYFVTEEGLAHEKWDDSRQALDTDKIFYSIKIDRYDDYRNILYGNNEGLRKDFGRFALLQSKQYQNIPRTIQNVFLNSKLEAEFIKQTIIMSLNEEDISIDLQSYMHHLKNFEEQLADIHQYNQPSVKKQAENAVKLHLAIRYLEKEKNQQSLYLAWNVANTERLIPRLVDKKEKAETEKELIVQKIENAASRFKSKELKIKAEISVLDNDLKRARERTDYYESIHIEQLLVFVNNRKNVQGNFDQLKKERETLTINFGEVSQKYEALLLSLENGLHKFEHDRNTEKLGLQQQSMSEEKAARKWMDQNITLVKKNNIQAVGQAREKMDQQKQLVHDEQLKKVTVKVTRFFEDEIVATLKNISDLTFSVKEARQQVTLLKGQDETFKKQWELSESGVSQDAERKIADLQSGIASQTIRSKEIEDKIQNLEDSFYGWLNRNIKDWPKNIGKVCSETLLFNNSLAPVKSESNDNTSLYGVAINLDEVSQEVKTTSDYQAEKKNLELDISKRQKQLHEFQQHRSEQLDKLRKKFQPLIKECKDGIIEQQYKIEQDNKKLQQAELQKKDLEQKAAESKRAALANVDAAIVAANEGLILSEMALRDTENELSRQIKAKEREYDKKIALIEQTLKNENKNIQDTIERTHRDYESRKEAIKESWQEELAGKGVDTKRMFFLEQRLTELELELQQIEKSRDTVTEYKKDKRELIDKTDEFKSSKTNLEQQFNNEAQKYSLQKDSQKKEEDAANEKIQQAKRELEQAEDDREIFVIFRNTETYKSIETVYKDENNNYKSDQRTKTLIDNINAAYYTAIQRLDDLKETINKFAGSFSSQNIFNFKTNFANRGEYLDFAEQLNDFISNSKIEEYVKRVNERFATIIHSVGKETGTLMSKAGEIQKVIVSINNDFDNKNFVGAIKKIELRLDESSNKVVQLLLQIKKFNDEHSYDLGGANLFSSVDQDSKNKKASDLLKQLGKAIADYKKESISLSDSFELKFRIEENQNDTGWVEKLSNVGSEGTDVLVKAMINIMLLNVFKEGASKRFKNFRLHCMMDEIGKLHPNNVKGILQFANDRNINLINGSPTENNALDYKHIYKLEKDSNRFTRIKRIITNHAI